MMGLRPFQILTAVAAASIPTLVAAQANEVPLFDDLGDFHFAVETQNPEAQLYFDQGMRLYYAFNHQEAIRSFKVAQALDPSCAMCWWAEGLAWGPNINLAMDEPSERAGYAAAREAVARRANASPVEQGLIDALAVRYEATPNADRRAALDSAYAQAMAGVVSRYPDHTEAAVLHAESMMDLRPWAYWGEDGELVPSMADAVSRLDAVIREHPEHPGACHFYIHAVEEIRPEWAVPCAERLAGLMPGAGHLVHMPGHIYIRVGRYADAVEANEHAVHADETYIQDQRPNAGMYTAGYYPHNYDFMAFAAAMAGAADQSVSSGDRLAGLIPPEMMGTPGMDFLQHWTTRPHQMRVRFGRWDELLATRDPGADLPHARAMWHYARGRAYVGKGDTRAAATELEGLRRAKADPAAQDLQLEFNRGQDILAIAEQVLTGRIAAAEGREPAAVAAMRRAVELEDALTYGEPPEWSIPTRQELGAVLLQFDRAAEAEEAFRADLRHFPDNGWSLYGLAAALRAQGNTSEADRTMAEFRQAWVGTEADIRSSLLGN